MRKDGQTITHGEGDFVPEAFDQFKSLSIPNKTVVEKALRAATLASIDKGRQEQLARIQMYLDECVGLQGEEMMDAARDIERLCESNNCVLRHLNSNGDRIDGSEFTLRYGRRRPDRGPILVREAALRDKMEMAIEIAAIPKIEAVLVESLDPRSQEIVYGRLNSRLLGQRTAASNLTPENRAVGGTKGGKARADKLSEFKRSDIAAKAAKSRWRP